MAIMKTNEKFIQEVYNLVGDEYEFLEEYKGGFVKIKVKHNKCGNIYKTEPSAFLQGHKCKYCNKEEKIQRLIKRNSSKDFKNKNSKRLRMSNQEFLSKVYELVRDEYTFLEEYELSSKKILVKHNVCGNKYYVTPNKFLQGRRCPMCANKVRKKTMTSEFCDISKRINNKYNNNFTLLEFNKIDDDCKIKCNNCNNEIDIHCGYLLYNNTYYKCKYCNQTMSNGEYLIEQYLIKNNIKYISEKRFDDCRNILPLPFDFYLVDYNTCIEFQGEQHYSLVYNFFGNHTKEESIKKLKDIQNRDKIKKDYCINNGINFIEITYDNICNITEILNFELKIIKEREGLVALDNR